MPVLVTVTFCVIFCPAATLPKFKVVGETVILDVCVGCEGPPTKPAQPFKINKGKSASSTKLNLSKRPLKRDTLTHLLPMAATRLVLIDLPSGTSMAARVSVWKV